MSRLVLRSFVVMSLLGAAACGGDVVDIHDGTRASAGLLVVPSELGAWAEGEGSAELAAVLSGRYEGEPARDDDGSIFGSIELGVDGRFLASAGEQGRFGRTEREPAAGFWGIEAFTVRVFGADVVRHRLVLTTDDGRELAYAFRSVAEGGASFELDDQPVTQTFTRVD